MAYLKDHPKLEILYALGTRITDAGLEHLKTMPSLKFVHLGGTKATEEGIQSLREACPDLRIVH